MSDTRRSSGEEHNLFKQAKNFIGDGISRGEGVELLTHDVPLCVAGEQLGPKHGATFWLQHHQNIEDSMWAKH